MKANNLKEKLIKEIEKLEASYGVLSTREGFKLAVAELIEKKLSQPQVKEVKDWEIRFDKATKDMVIIFPKAFIEDAKKGGFSTQIDLKQLKDLGIAKRTIKDFIKSLLTQERERICGEIEEVRKDTSPEGCRGNPIESINKQGYNQCLDDILQTIK